MNELIVQIKNGNWIIGDDDVDVDDGDDVDVDFDDDGDDVDVDVDFDGDVMMMMMMMMMMLVNFTLLVVRNQICHFVLPLKVGLIDLHFFPIHGRAKISLFVLHRICFLNVQ